MGFLGILSIISPLFASPSPSLDATQIRRHYAGSFPHSSLRHAPSFLSREDFSIFFPRRLASNCAYPRYISPSVVMFLPSSPLHVVSPISDRAGSEKTNSGPDTELEFWRRRAQRLTSITEQLKTKACKLVIGVLQQVKKENLYLASTALMNFKPTTLLTDDKLK